VINGRLRLRERRGAVPGEKRRSSSAFASTKCSRSSVRPRRPISRAGHVNRVVAQFTSMHSRTARESPGTTPLLFHISANEAQLARYRERAVREIRTGTDRWSRQRPDSAIRQP